MGSDHRLPSRDGSSRLSSIKVKTSLIFKDQVATGCQKGRKDNDNLRLTKSGIFKDISIFVAQAREWTEKSNDFMKTINYGNKCFFYFYWPVTVQKCLL